MLRQQVKISLEANFHEKIISLQYSILGTTRYNSYKYDHLVKLHPDVGPKNETTFSNIVIVKFPKINYNY